VDVELLKQALWLTLIGMGMTFAAIGALVLGMYALGSIKPRKAGGEAMAGEAEEAPVAAAEAALSTAEARYQAAVAAVAVARAQALPEVRRSAGAPVDQWRACVRTQQLLRRNQAARR